MGFRLSREAEEDIVAIAEHGVLAFGEAPARRYHQELFTLMALIADHPRMARERREIVPPVRIQPFKAHLVVYLIEDDNQVLVLRVRHAHENWESEEE
ncbi:type II toxin-antitoxin system RelE/ParE family toxin [Pseudorhizobium endolithicum]|uniref:Type II toxin-antitoxin system RelE/ParE family toxin n=1 Tax=Pseudorhizobium endolithicum TaxID=1191678 RepID=A0ABN7JC16_9HYPH|nr:type II toxin-antitoxin system RelE/ParE family toxin [Pseudorhizobium endolithicum]CAD6412132.1 type II toxin-antitoxin system RelE/ParE family toxin [Rhizobium sp. Q54]CAD7023574.1 type II toxin-antitoxin system RelE/ParE family toxin [Pseudorhizobium endolithicum]